VLGLDVDAGEEPFELTKRFVDLTPGAFPGYSLLSAFGEAAPLNFEYQRANRVIPFPFHFLNNNSAMNLKPIHYSWPKFYEHVIDLTQYTFSPRAIVRRLRSTNAFIPKWLNVVRAISSEGYGRIRNYTAVCRKLEDDSQFRNFFDQKTDEVPQYYVKQVEQDLGSMWHWLPDGALSHDPNAYFNSVNAMESIPSADHRVAVNE